MVHKRGTKQFYSKLQDVQALFEDHPRISEIRFDNRQNLYLPVLSGITGNILL